MKTYTKEDLYIGMKIYYKHPSGKYSTSKITEITDTHVYDKFSDEGDSIKDSDLEIDEYLEGLNTGKWKVGEPENNSYAIY